VNYLINTALIQIPYSYEPKLKRVVSNRNFWSRCVESNRVYVHTGDITLRYQCHPVANTVHMKKAKTIKERVREYCSLLQTH